MCLAVPAKVTEIDNEGFGISARVDVLGVTRKISLDLIPHAQTGDWVLVHAGAAIEVIDEAYANETIELLRSVPYLEADFNIFGEKPAELRADLLEGDAPVDVIITGDLPPVSEAVVDALLNCGTLDNPSATE